MTFDGLLGPHTVIVFRIAQRPCSRRLTLRRLEIMGMGDDDVELVLAVLNGKKMVLIFFEDIMVARLLMFISSIHEL